MKQGCRFHSVLSRKAGHGLALSTPWAQGKWHLGSVDKGAGGAGSGDEDVMSAKLEETKNTVATMYAATYINPLTQTPP